MFKLYISALRFLLGLGGWLRREERVKVLYPSVIFNVLFYKWDLKQINKSTSVPLYISEFRKKI